LLKDQEILILLINGDWILNEAVSEFSTTIRTNQVEIKSLTLFVLKCFLEFLWSAVLQDAINCLFTLRAV